MARKILIGAQVLAAVLFVAGIDRTGNQSWVSWSVPLAMVILIIINSVRFTRFVSWVIFGVSFFCLLTLLSAFTLRWRLESGFTAWPFYRAMLMYTVFIYVSLGQIKLLGGGASHASAPANPESLSGPTKS